MIKHHKDSNNTLVWGILLIGFGTIFLLQNLFDVEILRQIWQFWPLALIAWGVAIIVNRR